jgi:hypothetical protein
VVSLQRGLVSPQEELSEPVAQLVLRADAPLLPQFEALAQPPGAFSLLSLRLPSHPFPLLQ